ncbi:MAG: ABC transporter permease [Clostridiaceae bacterium]|nr:ABC transporter permease [Clostridiaceae bacterium]
MQVFKSYMKVLGKNKGNFILYCGIFMTIMIIIFAISSNNGSAASYTDVKCSIAIFDYDNSDASHALTDFISENNNVKELTGSDMEDIQDGLYIRYIDCAVIIKEKYSENLASGNINQYIEICAVEDRNMVTLFEMSLNSYLSYLTAYVNAGYDENEAYAKTVDTISTNADVAVLQASVFEADKLNIFFTYIGYVFVVLTITGVSPILIVFNRKELRDRISCSSYKYTNITKEIFLGTFVTGVILCLVFTLLAFALLRGELLDANAPVLLLNMCCYMVVSVSIAFLVSKITNKKEVLSFIGNIASLGMAFMSGIFVSVEFLGKGVVAAAHFLPSYWYARGVREIIGTSSQVSKDAWLCMGMELLFAAAIVTVAVVVDRTNVLRKA